MLTIQEILHKYAEDYRIFSGHDVHSLSIFSVSLSVNLETIEKSGDISSGKKERFVEGHVEIAETSQFLNRWKNRQPVSCSEVILLTTPAISEHLLVKLKNLKKQLFNQTIVLLQTKWSAEDLYFALLERISEENRQTKALISEDYFLLTDLLAKDASIEEIEAVAGKILGNPMIITDESFKVLAFSQGVDVTDPIWSIIVNNTYCPAELVKMTDYNQFWKRLKAAGSPLFVDSDDFSPYIRRAVAEIRTNGRVKGYIALLEKNKTITERDLFVLQMVADLIAIRLKQMDEISKAKGQMEREFLSELFSGAVENEKMAQNRAQSLGWPMCNTYMVLCVSTNSKYMASDHPAFSKLQQILRGIFPLCVFIAQSETGYFILGSQEQEKFQLSTYSSLENFLNDENLVCYAGKPSQTLTGIADSFFQAKNSYKVMGTFGREFFNKSIYLYTETAVFQLLSRLSPIEKRTSLLSGALYKLLEKDKMEGTEYVLTLRHFFLNNQNVSATAESMYLHRNTINYRLQKIRELLDENFDHPAIRLHLQLSLILHDMGLLK